jgi:arginyl-tRNA synthetase
MIDTGGTPFRSLLSIMETIQSILEERLRCALSADTDPAPRVTSASDPRFGDYQTNVAMILAKKLRANPRQIAARIIENIDIADICERPEIAGAGFINFRLRDEFLEKRFVALMADPRCGVARVEPKTIVVDFSAPNIAKPMHVGHIRSTFIGDALARIARFLGHNVITDNHIGDWGTQFGKVIYGYKHFLDEIALRTEPMNELLRLYKETNALSDKDEAIADECRLELAKLQSGDERNLEIWERCRELTLADLRELYAELGVTFDEWLGESFYNHRLKPLTDWLESRKIAEVSEGALCVFFSDDSELAGKPCLVRKSDGGFLYSTTDLATIEYRAVTWNPTEIWYVVGAPQKLHFEQVFTIARLMGVDVDMHHIAFGSILGEDRKLMRTRSGESVGLRDLLSEAIERAGRIVEEKNSALPVDEKRQIARTIGMGAVKYAELSQYRMTDYVFSWDKLLAFQGNTAPYLQNAYVRIRSIFRKLTSLFEMPEIVEFAEPAERTLGKKLFVFGETVPQVLDGFRPNILANYLYELANTFHAFYEACPVLRAESEAARITRLALCEMTARTLRKGLEILGIEVSERM